MKLSTRCDFFASRWSGVFARTRSQLSDLVQNRQRTSSRLPVPEVPFSENVRIVALWLTMARDVSVKTGNCSSGTTFATRLERMQKQLPVSREGEALPEPHISTSQAIPGSDGASPSRMPPTSRKPVSARVLRAVRLIIHSLSGDSQCRFDVNVL
ncbi:MAG: hypothetical protein ACI8P0_005136 [Planctomycetaceae bacterium]|jgi:hypothetical protein